MKRHSLLPMSIVVLMAGLARLSAQPPLFTTSLPKEEFAARRARVLERIARHRSSRERLLAVFDGVAETFSQPGYRGCAFVRANAEMPPGSVAKTVCDTARGWLHELFTTLAGEAGARNPVALAQQLMLLYDGALIAAQMDGDVDAAAAARGLAASLLDAATGRARASKRG